MLNHAGNNKQGNVVLNSSGRLPIGAVLEEPNAPALPEFTMARQPDGSVQFERVTRPGIMLRKRFALPAEEKKDNFVSEMQLEFRNDGAESYASPGYFVALGSTMPLHPNDFPTYTRLVWCVEGSAKAIDVTWFPAQTYPIVGVEKRAAREFYRERVEPAEWAGVTNQFFTTLLTPLNGKVSEMWGRRFEVPQEGAGALLGIEGALGMPGFVLEPGQTSSVTFQIYTGPKLYAQLAKLPHDEAAIMNFGVWKLVSQALLNFMNLLHSWVKSYGLAIILLTACVKAVLWPLQNAPTRRCAACPPLRRRCRS